MLSNIIIEGTDRLGKDTLVKGLLDTLGFFQVIHYSKPLYLTAHANSLEQYQHKSFAKMFALLDQGGMLLNRAHLGELVYAPRYRNYNGSYVYGMEEQHPIACNNTLLVLLNTGSWKPIIDDGDSFDFSKKDVEQVDFWRAWERSAIKYKLSVDVTCDDEFVPASLIVKVVRKAFETLDSMTHPILSVTWKKVDGEFVQVNDLRPDPRLHVTEL